MTRTRTPSLRALRRAKHLSIAQAADRFGISGASVSRIERGLQQPRPALAKRMSRYYAVPLSAVYR